MQEIHEEADCYKDSRYSRRCPNVTPRESDRYVDWYSFSLKTKISKITDPNKIGSRLMNLPTQEIVAFIGVFLWVSFWLNGGRLGKGHGAHQAVHSCAADGNAIVTE